MRRNKNDEGFSLVEALIAAAIAGIAFIGTLGAVDTASRAIHEAGFAGKAQAVAQSRLEAKRSVRWRLLLEDDLDQDGMAETIMRDDGQGRDQVAGDGVYTATEERDGIMEVWTIEVDRPGPMASVGMVTIRSVVTYKGSNGPRALRMETVRANPAFVGLPQL